ncbi:MAG TPA: glycosyltransferase family 39 protein [Thermomicrobiales bacterium]|nr:glycosyltransferase family 39 protein [Thermomicrobiales bacterium]
MPSPDPGWFLSATLPVGTSLGLALLVVLSLSALFDRVNYNAISPQPWLIAAFGILTLLACFRRYRIAAPMTILVGLATGTYFRVSATPFQGSDTLLVTRAGIDVMTSGGNPYSQFYDVAIPPSTYFPYFIGEPAFYWIHLKLFGDIFHADLVSGVITLLLFAALVPIVGWFRSAAAVTLYAVSEQTVMTAASGSNDVSLMLLVTTAVVLLIYSEARRTSDRWRLPLLVLAALFMGWALLFKVFALVFFPFIVLALRQRGGRWLLFGGIAAGLFTVAMAPYAIDDIGGVVNSLTLAGVPRDVWGFNIWTLINTQAPNFVIRMDSWIGKIQFPLTILLGLWLLLRRRSDLGSAILAGLAVCFSLVFLAKWTSGAYYSGFLTVLLLGLAIRHVPALDLWSARLAHVPTSLLSWPVFASSRQKATTDAASGLNVGTGLRTIVIHQRRRARASTDALTPAARLLRSGRLARTRARGQVTPTVATSAIPTIAEYGAWPTPRMAPSSHPATIADLPRLIRLGTVRLRTKVGQSFPDSRTAVISLIILLATMVGTALRLWQVDSNPPGMHQDEASAGYDAWSLWLTLRDHHGNPLPWVGLETFGDWVSPVLSYYLAPWVGIFGLDIGIIRIATALLGVAAIPLAFFATRELTNRTSTAVIAAWLLAVSPWAVHLSRYAIPPATIAPLFLLMLWLTLRALRVRTTLSFILAALSVTLLVSGYPTMKLYVPLVLGVIVVIYFRVWRLVPLRALAWAIVTLALTIGPTYAFSFLSPAAANRSRYLSYLNTEAASLSGLVDQYWSYISPTFLFVQGDGDQSHVQPGYGLEFPWLAPLLIIGLVVAILRAFDPDMPFRLRRPTLVLLAAFVLAPVPAAITQFQNSSRVAQIDPLIAILVAIGIVGLFDGLRRFVLPDTRSIAFRMVAVAMVAAILLPLVVQARDRYTSYYADYPRDRAVQWHFHSGIFDALAYARSVEDDYAEIYVGDVAQGYIVLLFIDQVDPTTVHYSLDQEVYDGGRYWVHEWGPYRLYDGRNTRPEPEEVGVPDIDSLPIVFESFAYNEGLGYVVREGINRFGEPILVIWNETR